MPVEKNIPKACVLGASVARSLSPKLHGFWLKQYGLSGDYTALDVAPENLKEKLEGLVAEGFSGCNLTAPLKEHALGLMDALDESAASAGAVNTVVMRAGKKTGYNSDGFGFMESLKTQHPAWDGAHIVILGAGGAARGIAAALKKAGAQRFTFVARKPEKAQALIDTLGLNANACGWKDRNTALKDATLLVNCTPLLEADIDPSLLPKTAAVADIVYRPLVTPLLTEAEKRGYVTIKGLPMLLHQGRLGFKQWFNVDPVVTEKLYEEIAAWAK